MSNRNIYVAGPVDRPSFARAPQPQLSALYGRIEQEANRAGITVQIPRPDARLDDLDPTRFAAEVGRRINNADGIIIACLPLEFPASMAGYSIGCEGQLGVFLKKPVAILTEYPQQTPRLLLAMPARIYAIKDVDYQQMFRYLLARPESASASAM